MIQNNPITLESSQQMSNGKGDKPRPKGVDYNTWSKNYDRIFRKKKKMSQLAKSKSKKMLFGVCGGIANYTGVDVSIVRLLWFFGTIFTGSLLLWLYIILAIILPTDL